MSMGSTRVRAKWNVKVRAQVDWLADEVKAVAPKSQALAELEYKLALHRNVHRKMTVMWTSVRRHLRLELRSVPPRCRWRLGLPHQ